MLFPISQLRASPLLLAGIGLFVGTFGALFGVGGSFIAGPLLFALGLPMRFVVGTDLASLVGTGFVAARRHRALGNVDIKLALVLTVGTMAGIETGAQLVARLARGAFANRILGVTSAVIFLAVSLFVGIESVRSIRGKEAEGTAAWERAPLIGRLAWLRLGPKLSFPVSGIAGISGGAVLVVGYVTGILSGLLGGGGGYLRMPVLVYLFGIPTHVAVGTDLFEVVLSASYGTLSHALKGNVDILIALAMNIGAVLGARFGVALGQVLRGPRLRLAFAPFPAAGAAILLYTLAHRGAL